MRANMIISKAISMSWEHKSHMPQPHMRGSSTDQHAYRVISRTYGDQRERKRQGHPPPYSGPVHGSEVTWQGGREMSMPLTDARDRSCGKREKRW
jgi:hypothetical protein